MRLIFAYKLNLNVLLLIPTCTQHTAVQIRTISDFHNQPYVGHGSLTLEQPKKFSVKGDICASIIIRAVASARLAGAARQCSPSPLPFQANCMHQHGENGTRRAHMTSVARHAESRFNGRAWRLARSYLACGAVWQPVLKKNYIVIAN